MALLWVCLGLLVAAAASLGSRADARSVARRAGEIAAIEDPALAGRVPPSNGVQVFRRYAIAGAREEARQGFPHIVRCAKPQASPRGARGEDARARRLPLSLAFPAALERTPPNFHWLADSALQQGRAPGLEKVWPDGSAPEKLV